MSMRRFVVALCIAMGVLASVSLASGGKARFNWTDTGSSGVDAQFKLNGFGTGEPGSSGTGTETDGESNDSWSVTWEVEEDGDIKITCGECGQTTTLNEGGESGSGTRNHSFGSSTGTWVNIDFLYPIEL